MSRIRLLTLLGTFLILAACDSSSVGPSDPADRTPRPDYTAENMALWVSGELTAPDLLYHQIHRELGLIEARYGDRIANWTRGARYNLVPRSSMGFEPAWPVSYVSLQVDSDAHERMAAGEHEQLNALLEKLGGTWQPFIQSTEDTTLWLDKVTWDGRLNSKKLCQYFVGMDGIRGVQTAGTAMPRSVILPVFDGGEHRYCYLVNSAETSAWTWYYFGISKDQAVLIDSFYFGLEEQVPSWPAWVDTVTDVNRRWETDHFSWKRP